jgi:hypothetical protein
MKSRLPKRLKESGALATTAGYALNGLGNALFLYLISINASSEVLLLTIVFWSAIFWAGTVLAPFETLFLYSRAKKISLNYSILLPIVGTLIFALSAVVVFVTLDASFMTIPIMAAIGYSNLVNIRNRPIRLASKDFNVVAKANTLEGVLRATLILLLTSLAVDLNPSMILTVFLFGNLSANYVYLRNSNSDFDSKEDYGHIDKRKIIGLSLIGASGALFSGGLPYFAGVFDDTNLTPYVTFYTITRLLLIIQSIITSIKPSEVNNFGSDLRFKKFLQYFFVLAIPSYFALLIIQKFLSVIGLEPLSVINRYEVVSFSISLILNSFLTIYISSLSTTNSWKISIFPVVTSAIFAIVMITSITDKVIAFQLAMSLSPLLAISLLLYRASRLLKSS